jgi:GNAT superfamily N-acetyltransferase
MNIVSVMFASPAYDELVNMRIERLYKPLNATISIENFAIEYKDVHLAFYDDHAELIGGILAKACEEEDKFMNKRKICLLKEVVVKEELQGLGYGTAILAALENLLINKGYKEIRLYTHVGAIDFYAKSGYLKHGKELDIHGIKQHVMKKKIQKKSEKLERLEPVGSQQ